MSLLLSQPLSILTQWPGIHLFFSLSNYANPHLYDSPTDLRISNQNEMIREGGRGEAYVRKEGGGER